MKLHNILEHPEILEETSKKDKELDERLKQVYVNTSHIVEQKRVVNPNRPLPTSTKPVGFFELGFKETDSDKIPPGKCSLRQAVKFIEDYKMNPEVWTKEKIASEYKLNPVDVENVLEHFQLFMVSIPPKGEEKKKILSRLGSYDSQNFDKYIKLIKEKSGQQNASIADLFRDKNEKQTRK